MSHKRALLFHSIQSSLVLQVWQTHVTDVKVLKRLSISSVVFSCAQMLIFSAFLDTDGLIKISGAILFSLRMMHYHRVEIALELALGRVVIFVDKSSLVDVLWREVPYKNNKCVSRIINFEKKYFDFKQFKNVCFYYLLNEFRQSSHYSIL